MSNVLCYDHGHAYKKELTDDLEKLIKDKNIPTLGLCFIKNGVVTEIKIYGTLEGKLQLHKTAFLL